MTALLLVLLLGFGLIVAGVGGPWLVRRAVPVLVRVPRLAAVALLATAGLWVLTLLALGPMLSWVNDGPALLTGPAGEVCQRCLDSANPFGSSAVSTIVPTVALLGIPVLGGALLVGAGVAEVRRRRRRTAGVAAQLLGEPATVLGHQVWRVPDQRPYAFALPARHGGIVVSDGCLGTLEEDELAAVLAHEQAHVQQRHHLVLALVGALVRALSWVPLLAAIRAALPHYLEIAADDAARRRAGTPALASALLRLGERAEPAAFTGAGPEVLHAAGPDRIRHLVCPPEAGGHGPAAVVAVLLTGLAVVNAAVHLPLLLAAWGGCL
ncbi:M56 family metallopeptidase [Ruania zhangjianzhongii]|uniref:M56 family metallopeptidase n=1 Tax=Ruania zhangjianzhongii TaxID=2603206 RepID=UPI0011C94C7D|nr:M56 family metallopeptidase [Ruania zhangjianzhongii]